MRSMQKAQAVCTWRRRGSASTVTNGRRPR